MKNDFSNERNDPHRTGPSRRALLLGAGAAVMANTAASAQVPAPKFDHTITIEPVALELAPGKIIKTTGYNGKVPGPVLRLQEGRPVNIKVINNAGYDDSRMLLFT